MGFPRDVFISYAHLDNQVTDGGAGWVSKFHEALRQLLSQFKGGEAQIWRDEKLRGNDVFADEIVDQFPKTATLVSVLTPRYLKSDWCTREIKEFCGVAQQTGGILVQNKARVFKVIKTPFAAEDGLPPVVSKVLGYEFYELDEGAPIELDPQLGEKSRLEFRRKVNKLAWDIKQMLDQLDSELPAADPAKPMVYLAECSRDRREAREMVQAELQRHGYTVLPDRQLPTDEADYVAAVQELLAKCRLSVHLIGAGYGLVPDGPGQKSVVMLQNELAVTRCKQGGLQRVIWLPAGTTTEQVAQQQFIDALHNDAVAQFGAELLTGDLESLKGTIHAALKKLEQPAPAQPAGTGPSEEGRRLVYVVCHEKDRKDTIPLLKFLKAHGLEARLPAFSGDPETVDKVHKELLLAADAVVLFYGAGDGAWMGSQQNELLKIGGLRRDRPLLAAFTYLAGPGNDDKDLMLAMEEPNLIDGLNGFSDAAMDSFVAALAPQSITA